MSFAETIATIPFTPTSENGRGFLPPFLRVGGHLLYLLGRLTDTPTRRPTDNQIRAELDSLKNHFVEWVKPDYMSQGMKDHIANFEAAFNSLDTEINDWDYETKVANIQMLTNRLVQLSAFLDREILGIRDSDAGQEL